MQVDPALMDLVLRHMRFWDREENHLSGGQPELVRRLFTGLSETNVSRAKGSCTLVERKAGLDTWG